MAVLASGCGATRIFHATFESDTIGELPSMSPPESPTGDYIYVSDVSGAGTSLLAVTALNPLTGGRSLRYRNIDTPTYNRYVGFISKEITPDPDERFYASWNGTRQGSGSALRIWLGDGHVPRQLVSRRDR